MIPARLPSPFPPLEVAMSTASTAPITPERILQFAWGYAPPLILEAAIRHHVFDVLDAGPLSLAQLAKATGPYLNLNSVAVQFEFVDPVVASRRRCGLLS